MCGSHEPLRFHELQAYGISSVVRDVEWFGRPLKLTRLGNVVRSSERIGLEALHLPPRKGSVNATR